MTMIDRKAMPKGWKSPFRVELFQVVVDLTKTGEQQLVGPKVDKETAGELCETIKSMIKAGHERKYSNPRVIKVKDAHTQTA